MAFRLSHTSLTTQFGIFFAMVFFVPLLMLGSFFYLELRDIQTSNTQELTFIAALQKANIEQFLQDEQELLLTVYRDETLRDHLATQIRANPDTTIDVSAFVQRDSVLGLWVFDRDGNLIAASKTVPSDVSQVLDEAQMSFGIHDLSFVDGSLTGLLGGPYSIPNGFEGVLVIETDFSELAAMQTSFASLSATGEMMLVVQDGTSVRRLTPARFSVPHDLPVSMSAVDRVEVRALNVNTTTATDLMDYRGEMVFAATSFLPAQKWGLVVKKDAQEILVPMFNLFQTFAIALTASLLLLILIGIYLRRYVLEPIERLTTVARKIQRGIYAQEEASELSAPQEIGTLAKAFQRMSDELIQANQTLEAKVKQRTSRLRRTLSEVRAQKVKDDALLSSIAEGMIATDAKGVIVLVNDSAQELLGFTKKELVGRPLMSVLSLKDPKGKTLHDRHYPTYEVLTHRRRVNTRECQARRKDKRWFPVELSASPVMLGDALRGSILILGDITKEKEVDRMKTEFIGIASHQLRAPLASMKWYGELLMKGEVGKLTKAQKDFVSRINISTDRMVSLVNDFLSVSRIEQGTLKRREERVDVSEMVTRLVELADHDVKAKGLALVLSLPRGRKEREVHTDPDMLREILGNLIQNAIKYTLKGRIDIRVTREETQLTVAVTDTGYGISLQDQKKLFTKFFRASEVVKQGLEGTGLGLYTARRLSQELGGTITVHSELGKGSTFIFTMPV